jgi:hypothetical protein
MEDSATKERRAAMKKILAFRDVFWLAALVAIAVAWQIDHRRMSDSYAAKCSELSSMTEKYNQTVIMSDDFKIDAFSERKRLVTQLKALADKSRAATK